jgi:hypothetical protein
MDFHENVRCEFLLYIEKGQKDMTRLAAFASQPTCKRRLKYLHNSVERVSQALLITAFRNTNIII